MISKDKLKEIDNEFDKFDLDASMVENAINHKRSAGINAVVQQLAMFSSQAIAFIILYKADAFWGKGLAAVISIGIIAGVLKNYSTYRSEKELKKEYERFMQQLKDKGIYDGNSQD